MLSRITFIVAMFLVTSCNTLKDIARTVDNVADIACELFGQENPAEFEHLVRTVLPPGAAVDAEKSGFDPRVLCTVKEVVQPFIDDQLRMQRETKSSLRMGMSGGVAPE